MVTCLGLNGEELAAPESEGPTIILQIAASRVTGAHVAEWLRHHTAPTRVVD